MESCEWIALAANIQNESKRDWCNKTVDIFQEVKCPEVTNENRGKPMFCWYSLKTKPSAKDWIISIRFNQFKVGRLANSTTCLYGYVQIIDGQDEFEMEVADRMAAGYFCGEIDNAHTFISETNQVMVLFYVEHFTEETYFAFETRGEQQYQLYARHGPNPQLHPGRRGRVISGTYCDRILEDCRLGSCYIQSPGYPGVYPRNLRCKYQIKTTSKYVRLFTENELIDVGGQRCSDIILCPVKPVTRQCSDDHIQIYDGATEMSPLVGTFCGRGKFPYSIVGSGKELLIVFTSSPVGPLISTGFSFNVGFFSSYVGPGAILVNGSSCDAVFHSSSHVSSTDRQYYSLSTWYSPNSKCSLTILGELNEIVRLRFKTFRVNKQQHAIVPSGECGETLTIYDSHTRDDSKLITTFCDTWSSPVDPIDDIVSTGPALYVQFISLSGSYFGSSLDYRIQFDFFNAFQYGQPVKDTQCEEMFATPPMYSTRSQSSVNFVPTVSAFPHTTFLHHGVFTSPLNNLVYYRKSELQCRYKFDADASLYSRVLIAFTAIVFASRREECIRCVDNANDKIIVEDFDENATNPFCICDSSLQSANISVDNPITYLSVGSRLNAVLSISPKYMESYFDRVNQPIFQGSYEFLHGFNCGPPFLDVQNQGELVFPDPTRGHIEDGDSPPLRCIWTIQVSMRKDVYLRFDYINIQKNCSFDRIEIRIPNKKHVYTKEPHQTICGLDQELEYPIISSSSMTANRILVEFVSTSVADQSFKMVWTELSQVEHHSKFTMEMAAASTDCSFICEESNTCIPQELVCNGVRNCPSTITHGNAAIEIGADEDIQVCRREESIINWWAIGFGVAGVTILATCLAVIIHKCCKKCHDHDNSDPG